MGVDSRITGRDERAGLLPAPLLPVFDDAFVRSCDLVEEYVARLALRVVRECGLDRASAAGTKLDAALAQSGLPATAAAPVRWLLAVLAGRGWASVDPAAGDPEYRVAPDLPPLEAEEIAAAQAAHDARCLPSYRIAAYAAAHYPAVLRGETTGENVLAGVEAFDLWSAYFSNDNPLYAVSNSVGAVAAVEALQGGAGRVLELGTGLGSGAEAILARAAGAGAIAAYLATDASPLFLRRAKRLLGSRFAPVTPAFASLDIDAPFAAAGIAPASFDLVYGVNVLHVARDLGATLAEIRAALAPGGALVISECVRPAAGEPVYVEFVFNLLQSFRSPVLHPQWRPCGGFLTPEQWQAALTANRFAGVSVYPDLATIRAHYPAFIAAAVVARRA